MSIEKPIPSPPSDARWGSDYIAELMRALDIEYLALTPGASYRGLHDSLVNHLGNQKPGMLLTLHEESAVAIAHGYAKVTGKPLGVMLHSNVGLMHASMAIFNAWCDRVPMLIYGATGPMDAHARRPFVDWQHTVADQAALVRHFIKWDNQPASLPAAAEAMLRAKQISLTAPCAPTYVVFDAALQEMKIEGELPLPPVERFAPPQPAYPSPTVISSALDLLTNAGRPLILAGRGGRGEAAWNNRIALAELLNARVLTNLRTAAAFPSSHALHAGTPIKFVDEATVREVAQSDVILSLDWWELAGLLKQVWPSGDVAAKVLQVSVDVQVHNGYGMEHLGLPLADVNVLAEPDAFTEAMVCELAKTRQRRSYGARPCVTSSGGAASNGIGVRTLAHAINNVAGSRETCLIRLNLGWPADMTAYQHPLDYLGGDGGGGIGAGPGMTVGAALALRGTTRLPLAVLGDGDFIMGVSALWTATHYQIPLMMVVANNRSFFNDEMHQERIAKQRGRPVENKWIGQRMSGPDIDIAALARAQGALAFGPVARGEDLTRVLLEAADKTRQGHVVVVEVLVHAEYDTTIANSMVRGSQ